MALKFNLENKKQVGTIALAIGLGLMAAWLMSNYVETTINTRTEEMAREYEKRSAAMLQEQLNQRDKQMRAQIEQMAQEYQAQMQKVAQDAAAAKAAALLPRAAPSGPQTPGATRTVAAEVVENTKFSLLTPSGKRAMTILIDSLSAVGGLINPGDYVDILATLKLPDELFEEDSPKKEITSILFQNIQVLAIGPRFSPNANAAVYQQQQQTRSLNVTLAVDPEEAGLITFSQKYGKLMLALRSPVEKETRTLEVAEWNTLSDYVYNRQGTELEIPEPEKPKPKIQETTEIEEEEVETFIEVFRGGTAF